MIDFDETIICLTLDTDWSCPEVLHDTFSLIADRNLPATIFISHAGVEIPNSFESALHPNYRSSGELAATYINKHNKMKKSFKDHDYYKYILDETIRFAPEATGIRSHSLIFDSILLNVYSQSNISYDSTYIMPLVDNIHPFRLGSDVSEFPIFFNDHFELKFNLIDFNPSNLNLHKPGLKVLQFHPQMIYINATTDNDYQSLRQFYHDPTILLSERKTSYGVRDLFQHILDLLSTKQCHTLSDVDKLWRESLSN